MKIKVWITFKWILKLDVLLPLINFTKPICLHSIHWADVFWSSRDTNLYKLHLDRNDETNGHVSEALSKIDGTKCFIDTDVRGVKVWKILFFNKNQLLTIPFKVHCVEFGPVTKENNLINSKCSWFDLFVQWKLLFQSN